jgi:Methyltransferase domain
VETLHELALMHGTDKATPRRSLAAIYDPILAPRRDAEVTVLEIGVFGGASLRMWRDFFARGRIFGIDINPEAMHHEDSRIRIFIGDQTDVGFLDEVISTTGPLSVVLDDGGHRARQQIGSLLRLWPAVEPGGIYIVEDTHTSYMDSFAMGWRKNGSTIEFLKGVVDDVHCEWHEQPQTLTDVASINFHRETCILQKS